MPGYETRRRLITLALPLLVASLGCGGRLARTLVEPRDHARLDAKAPYLKAHMRDGGLYVLRAWTVDEAGRRVRGDGDAFDALRERTAHGALELGLDDVAIFETNRVQKSPGITALAVITGISAAVTMACAINPKACFGSCPTFYVGDGPRERIQAEGFSGSVAPSLEAHDVDALYRVRPRGRDLTVTMRNEALETHVVRYVDLLVAPRRRDERVIADAAGSFWRVRRLAGAIGCTAADGDCRAALAAFDGAERFRPTDEDDLARRETIELRFVPRAGRQGLVIAARQSLLSTYVFYQGLSYMGRQASDALAALERGDTRAHGGIRALDRALGGIEVLTLSREGEWTVAGELHEHGPLATDVKVVTLPEDALLSGRLRLRLTQGHWRLDHAAVGDLHGVVRPVRVPPSDVLQQGKDGSGWNRVVVPHRPTLPGDTYRYRYRLPRPGPELELFLETRGYYLEWMRDEWLREESPRQAARLFADPAQALRTLAAPYKQQEAAMESLFWRSRYVEK